MVDDAALAARLTDHLGEMAGAGDREGRGIHRAKHVEVDEAVVEWRDQRIGHRMGEPHQVAVVAGRVDDHEVMAVLERVHRLGERAELRHLVVDDLVAIGAGDAVVRGKIELELRMLAPSAAIFDVVREALLP